MRGVENEMAEAWRHSQRHGESFVWYGDNSAYQEAPEVISQGSWRLCIPSLIPPTIGHTKQLG